MGDITWTNDTRKLSQLIPWPRNPRQIKGEQVARLQASFEQFGQPEVIAIGPGNEVYNGHQRLKSWAAKFGDVEVACRVASRPLTEKEREKLTVFLHRGTTGEWDFDTLANEFEVAELVEWGFSLEELGIQDEPKGDDPGPQVDRAEELRVKWGVELGQLWQLGEHRLICGDCTDRAVVERVMGGEKAELILTDPPYGLNVTKKESIAPGLNFGDQDWDMSAPTSDQLNRLLKLGEDAIIWGANCMALPVSPFWLVWDKQTDGLIFSEFELAWTTLKVVPRIFRKRPQNMDGGKVHPTQKPLDLMEWCLGFAPNADCVADPFVGSGTTLIACERLGRKCRAVEIDPGYCAVTIQRWADMTGCEPKLIDDDRQ